MPGWCLTGLMREAKLTNNVACSSTHLALDCLRAGRPSRGENIPPSEHTSVLNIPPQLFTAFFSVGGQQH